MLQTSLHKILYLFSEGNIRLFSGSLQTVADGEHVVRYQSRNRTKTTAKKADFKDLKSVELRYLIGGLLSTTQPLDLLTTFNID